MMLSSLTFLVESAYKIHGGVYHECERKEDQCSIVRVKLRILPFCPGLNEHQSSCIKNINLFRSSLLYLRFDGKNKGLREYHTSFLSNFQKGKKRTLAPLSNFLWYPVFYLTHCLIQLMVHSNDAYYISFRLGICIYLIYSLYLLKNIDWKFTLDS